jgi:MFS family permease
MHEPHDAYAALRYRDYRLLLAAGIIGSIGTQMQAVAVGWDLYQRTGSAAALGGAGLAEFLPVLVCALPAGHAADRYNRSRLYQLAQGVMGLASVGLAAIALWQGPVPLIYGCLLLTGCSRAVSAPARQSLLPQIVPDHILSNAITWNSSGWQIANVAGPALGGLVIAVTGEVVDAYRLAAMCSLVSAALAIPIRPRAVARAQEPPSFASLSAGIRFLARSRLLLAAITLDLFAVLLGGATALLPIYAAAEILDVGPTGLGWLRAAPAIGAFVMALALAHRRPLRRPGQALLLAVTGFGLATIVFGFSRDPTLSFFMLALTGALDNVSVVVRHTLVQMLTPDSMRGRVSAVNLVFISSSNELGAFESGMTAHWFGPVASVVGGGIGTIVVVLAVMLRWPELIRLGPLHRVVAEGVTPNDVRPSGAEGSSKDGLPAEKEA